MVIGISECMCCNKLIKKGEQFSLIGKHPGIGNKLAFGSLELDQFSNCDLICSKCFDVKYQKR